MKRGRIRCRTAYAILVMSQMPGNLPSATWLTSITSRSGLVSVKTW